MQHNPPSDNNHSNDPDRTLSWSGENGQSPPEVVPDEVKEYETYSEPTYREYGQSAALPTSGTQAQNVPPAPDQQSGFVTPAFSGAPGEIEQAPISPASSVSSPAYPGYPSQAPVAGSVSSPAHPGYPAQTQPGYVPSTPPQGYPQNLPAGTFSAPSQPGYFAQTLPPPGYLPPTPPPGYPAPTPPPGYPSFSQPGYPLSPQFVPLRRTRLHPLALLCFALAGLIVLAGIITGVVYLAQRNTPNISQQLPPTTAVPNSTPTQSIHPTSAFQSAPCPFTVGSGLTEGKELSCGYVTVPADHSSNTGKMIKLAVAIFKGQQYTTSTDPDPVLRLEGGPGGPSLANWAKFITAQNYDQFIFDHDTIMFDQRGTGYSTPSLQCPELINLQYSTTDVSSQTYESSAQQCYNRLNSQGDPLNDFNSIQNAGDVSSLIQALGYKQMTLYGVSYGTRLALTVMRLYPAVVHGVILDSTYPTNHNRNDLPSDAQRVFNVLFQGCAKDTRCNARYPNLQSVFYNLVDTLNTHPVSFPTIDQETGKQYTAPFSGNDLVGWLFSALYATSFIQYLPEVIYQVKAQQYDLLSQLYGALEFDSTFSDGMFYTTTCSEDWAFLTKQDIATSEQGIDPHIVKVFGLDEQQEYDICQFWKVPAVPAVQKQPVTSSLPTLILAGEYDPITPPANGQEVATKLSHSYFYLFPGQGHGQEYSSDCSNSIVSAFEDNVSQKPDGSCIAQMTEPAFQ